ncbi:hypothetical protein QEN19_003792 [Hanseniaspora menglaensis]
MEKFSRNFFESLDSELVKATRFSEIYKLKDLADGQFYCLKKVPKIVPKPHSSEKELSIMKMLDNNSNIVPLLGSWNHRDEIVLAMPFYNSMLADVLIPHWRPVQKKKSYLTSMLHVSSSDTVGTISEQDFFINKTPKSLIQKVTTDLFKALSFLHENKIIHRDIKLDNVMYSSETDQFVVIDFGISCVFDGSKDHDGITDIATGYYKPIEALLGIKKYDQKLDVWSAMVLIQQLSLAFICCYDIPLDLYQESVKNGGDTPEEWISSICALNIKSENYDMSYNHIISENNFPTLISDGSMFYENTLCQGSDIKLLSNIHGLFGCPLQNQFPLAKEVNSWLYFFNNLDNPTDKYFADSKERKAFIKKMLFQRFDNDAFADECLLHMCFFEPSERITFKECLDVCKKWF